MWRTKAILACLLGLVLLTGCTQVVVWENSASTTYRNTHGRLGTSLKSPNYINGYLFILSPGSTSVTEGAQHTVTLYLDIETVKPGALTIEKSVLMVNDTLYPANTVKDHRVTLKPMNQAAALNYSSDELSGRLLLEFDLPANISKRFQNSELRLTISFFQSGKTSTIELPLTTRTETVWPT